MLRKIEIIGTPIPIGPHVGVIYLASGRLYNLIRRFKFNKDSVLRDFWILIRYALEDIVLALEKGDAIKFLKYEIRCDDETNPVSLRTGRKVGIHIMLMDNPLGVWSGGFELDANEDSLIIEYIRE